MRVKKTHFRGRKAVVLARTPWEMMEGISLVREMDAPASGLPELCRKKSESGAFMWPKQGATASREWAQNTVRALLLCPLRPLPPVIPSLPWPEKEGCLEQVALELGLQAKARDGAEMVDNHG